MGRIIPYIMENKKCSKPPTSSCLWGPSDLMGIVHWCMHEICLGGDTKLLSDISRLSLQITIPCDWTAGQITTMKRIASRINTPSPLLYIIMRWRSLNMSEPQPNSVDSHEDCDRWSLVSMWKLKYSCARWMFIQLLVPVVLTHFQNSHEHVRSVGWHCQTLVFLKIGVPPNSPESFLLVKKWPVL